MGEKIDRDKAIAALSEINKLRHELNEKILSYQENDYEDEIEKGVCLGIRKNLTAALERAYEILNEKEEK